MSSDDEEQVEASLDLSESDVEIPESDSSSESSDVSNLSPIRNTRKNKVNAIISDDEDDDEEEVCSYSPRTRKSITGVRQIYSSDESTDFSSDDNGDSKVDSFQRNNNESADKFQVTSKSYPINDPDADDVSGMEMSKYKSVNIEDPDIDDDNETSNSNNKSQIKSFTIDDSDISNNQMDITKYRSVNIEDPDDDDKENNEMEITKNKSAANINESINNSIINMTIDEQSKISIIESSMRQMELDQNHSQKSIQRKRSDSSSSDDCVIVQDSPSNIGKKFINRIRENATSTPSSKVILKQPTIKTAINENKKPTDIQMEVSQEFYDNALKKLQELEFELKNSKHLAEKMGSKLPDNGRRMSERINNLQQKFEEQLRKISTYTVIDEKKSVLEIKKNIAAAAAVPSWDELNAAANTIEPRFKGKIGLANFNAGKALTIDRLKDMHGSLETCPISSTLAEQPFGIQVPLMRHQLHAIAWMTWRESQKPRGGILADDMGLGKTLTVISLVLSLKHRKENIDDGSSGSDNDDDDGINNGWSAKGRRDYHKGNNLVICPASLIGQWEKEIKQHCKRNLLTILVHHGTNRDTKPKYLAKFDFVITTYNIASREKKSSGAIFKIDWNRIILDEAHVIRNHKSAMSIAVCALKGKYRWTLTGTPIQNKEQDAYALLKFLKCSPFNDLAHWKKWIDNKTAGGRQRLNTLMTSLMLRRTKIQLLEIGELQGLPEKDIQLIEVTLDKNEMNVYSKIMVYSKTLFAQFLHQRAEKNADMNFLNVGGRPQKETTDAYYKAHKRMAAMHGTTEVKSHQILVLLLRLRQICCHPGLINAMLEDETNQSVNDESNDCDENEIDLLDAINNLDINELSGTAENDIPEKQTISKASSKVLSKSNPVFDLHVASSKIRQVLDVLDKRILNTDDKAVIVSQWTSVLNILAYHLERSDIKYVSINGKVPVKARQDIINDFNKVGRGPKVMLLSLTAGGVGLNLIGGNHLFLLDLHWNPQLEAQAQDRIYRVGQTKKVFIYKFMCIDTVEQRIKALQDHKLEIANGILTGSKVEGSKLTLDDLKSLFGM